MIEKETEQNDPVLIIGGTDGMIPQSSFQLFLASKKKIGTPVEAAGWAACQREQREDLGVLGKSIQCLYWPDF